MALDPKLKLLLRVFNETLRLDLTSHEERRWLALALDTEHDTTSALVDLQVEIRAEFRRKLVQELEVETNKIMYVFITIWRGHYGLNSSSDSTVWQLRLPSRLVSHYKEMASIQAMKIIQSRRMKEDEAAREVRNIKRRLLERSVPM